MFPPLLKVLLVILLITVMPVCAVSADSEQPLRIVTGRSSFTLVIEKLVNGFLSQHPNAKVEVVTLGSLQAMEEARRGAADVFITYYRPGEGRLLKEGVVSSRIEFMFSSYVILGPPDDPLGLVKETSIRDVLRRFSENESAFIISSQRGGTYKKMVELWTSAGINPDWPWYEIIDTTSLGVMRIAADQSAYTMGDIGTYLLNKEELSSSLVPLYQGGYELHKPFSVMSLNYEKSKRKKNFNTEKFVDFIISVRGQQIISQINKDVFNGPVFFPAAHFDPGVIAKKESVRLQTVNRNLYIVTGLLTVTGSMLLVLFYMFFRTRYLRREKVKAEIDKGIAELANNTKSEFLSRMSHELRTPMNAILGFSQLLEMKEQDEEKRRNLHEIVSAGQHLHLLIDDVLELSNIENNHTKILIEEVDVDGVIGDCITLCQDAVNKNQLNLSVKGPVAYKVRADVTRLKEVLINLITNAAKYNKPNGTIILEKKVIDENWLRLSVIDTGRGISKERQKKLFEPFERLGLELSGIEGTGIGLVISKNLVELMSGRIGFESKSDQGSTFWIEFMLVV